MQLDWNSKILGRIFLIKLADDIGSFLNWLSILDHATASKKPVTRVPKIEVQEQSIFVSYAHFSPNQKLEDCDRKTVNQISSLTDHYVISTNKPKLMGFLEEKKVAIQGRNLGFDLAMHRDVVVTLNKSSVWPRYLILTNNSLTWESPNGFELQIQECIKLSDRCGATIIFMTESLQPSFHLQSYFIFFNTSDKKTQELIYATYSKCRNWRWKRTAVFFGEKRLLTNLGLNPTTFVMFPIDALWALFKKRNNHTDGHTNLKVEFLNPSQHLLTEMKLMGAQFQKKQRTTRRSSSISLMLGRILNEK